MEEKVHYNYKVNRQGQRKYNYKVNRQGQRKYNYKVNRQGLKDRALLGSSYMSTLVLYLI